MSIAWTPIRLSMSPSSSRTSSLGEHVNAVRTTTKLSSNPTLSLTSSRGSNNYCGQDYLQQRQETVLEKQTVRITPAPSYADGPKSTVIIHKQCRVNGFRNVRSPNDCSSNSQSATADGHYFLDRSEFNSRILVDKECQTDEFCEFRRTTSSKSTNMDDSNECGSNDFSSNTNEQVQSACDEVDRIQNCSNTSDLYSGSGRETEQVESKDRDNEHIDVVVRETRDASDVTEEDELSLAVVDEICAEKRPEDGPEIENEEVKSNGFLADSEIRLQKNDSSKLKEEDKHLKEEEDDDSCCVNCLYISLNICDCVIV